MPIHWNRIWTRIPFHSIRFRLIAAALAILFPLWVYFLYNNLYAIGVVRKQVANSNKNLVAMYMQVIDDRLNSAEKYLANTLAYSTALQDMQFRPDPDDRGIAKTLAFQQMTTGISAYEYITCAFAYAVNTGTYFSVYGLEDVPYAVKLQTDAAMKRLIDQDSGNTVENSGYFPIEIDGHYYLLRVLREGALYVGAWFSVESMQVPLSLIDFGKNGTSLFATADGRPMNNADFVHENGISLDGGFREYYLSGSRNEYLTVGETSRYRTFSLVALIPDKSILENLGYFNQLAFIISGIFILVILACVLFIRKSVIRPLRNILAGMNHIQDGDLDHRILSVREADEFMTINRTFNRMMDQIRDLKISVYEEQLGKQQEELEHLRLQVSPHFFMNSLNIIYSLAQIRDFKLVQEMTLCLFRYFSYISRKNMRLVQLEEEIQHIRNYLRIQELRFPNGFIPEIDVPDAHLAVLVPPLVIQVFVENVMKYALTMDDPIHLSIRTTLEPLADGKPGMLLSIRNTGSRIEDAILEQLRAGGRIIDQKGEHTGIRNIRRRLELIYAGEAALSIRNAEPDGVLVEIHLPLQPQTTEREA